MKRLYKCWIGIAVILYFVLFFVLKTRLEFSEWVTTSVILGGTVAAIITAIIIYGIADKPPKPLDFTVKPLDFTVNIKVNKDNITTYDEADFASPNLSPKEIEGLVELGIPYVSSYQVYFNITNVSGFTLNKPVVTFELPKELRHPHKRQEDGKWIPYFRSNLYNVPYVQLLESGDRIVLSNNIVPYFNNKQKLEIWIRMCLSMDNQSEYSVSVSLNCDNAEGKTEKLTIRPDKLLAGLAEDLLTKEK